VIDEDREVEGLGEQELLDLYRSMVLLRTYDERSLVYRRQGRPDLGNVKGRLRDRARRRRCSYGLTEAARLTSMAHTDPGAAA
jgi:hypothetical protein